MINERNNELDYQLTMSLVRQLERNGIITDSEYGQIETIMLRKYRPVIGTLLAGKALTEK